MQHPDLQEDKWSKLSIAEQMANIGSEVIRAINWKEKGNQEYAHLANVRALELFDLTLKAAGDAPKLKEIARARELWLDYFVGENIYSQNASLWQNYFLAFTYAARSKN